MLNKSAIKTRMPFEAKLILVFIGIFTLMTHIFMHRTGVGTPTIRSDAEGYYAYLPAVFIHRDITMVKLANSHYGGQMPLSTGIVKYGDSGKYFDKYALGEAIMQTPSFVIAHVLSRLNHYPTDGYSFFYQFVIGITSGIYLLIGLFFLYKLLVKYFSSRVAIAALITVTFGTNLFHYTTYDGVFSHVYAFTLFAMFLYYTDLFYEKPKLKYSLCIGIIGALIILVRNLNFYFLLFFPLYGIWSIDTLKDRGRFLWEHRMKLVYTFILFCIVLLPQFLYWKYITGEWFVSSYSNTNENFFFTDPKIKDVLFSPRKGLFFWAPVLLFSIPGFIFMFKKNIRNFLLPSILFLTIHTYFVASWWAWWFGGSFGHRAYTESSVIFAIAIACFYASLKKDWLKVIVASIAIFLILLCMVQTYQYWRGVLPGDGMTWRVYKMFFLKF